MPLSFAVAYAGHLLGGDYRIGNLLALTAAGGLLGWAARARLGVATACLLLLTPRLYYVVYNGWSEPVVMLCLVAVVVCAVHRSAALPWMVGLLLASKQYMFLSAPAALLLIPRPWKTSGVVLFYAKALLIAAAVTLPLALWDIHAFLHTVVELPMKSPFRLDSLSITAAWARGGRSAAPGWVGFAAGAAAVICATWRAPRTPAGFAGAVAVSYLCFFAAAKQAFGNYYFVPVAALCCVVMAAEMAEETVA
jgi:hypothetical protein